MGELKPEPREMERANTRGLHSCSRGQSGPECGDRNPGMHVRGSVFAGTSRPKADLAQCARELSRDADAPQ